ncbi:MAG: glucosaminidase domain-containing protein [Chromatiaceae bacterium]|nr:glucosaminidase domain-containing protein [Chromatiaceae bacterium]
MKLLPHVIVAASLALAVRSAWAASPYFPHRAYPNGAAYPPTYAYPASVWLPSPVIGHPHPPRGYFPLRAPAPWGYPAPAAKSPKAPPATAESPKTDPGGQAQAEAASEVEAVAVDDAKARFLQRLQPLVAQENERLRKQRKSLLALVGRLDSGDPLNDRERKLLASLADTYRVDGDPLREAETRQELLDRVDVIPISLALAQAANESAWGQSRFAKEGNNLFGLWTYDEKKGLVPRKRAAGKTHLVRKFDSIGDSVRYYMLTLNSHPAYTALREIRAALRDRGQPLDGHSLADGLSKYSARGEEYVRSIQDMIRRFELASYEDAGRNKA